MVRTTREINNFYVQFILKSGGQFALELSGQFDRFFHIEKIIEFFPNYEKDILCMQNLFKVLNKNFRKKNGFCSGTIYY